MEARLFVPESPPPKVAATRSWARGGGDAVEKLRNMQVRELKEELAALDEPDSKNQQARLSLLLLLLFV